MQKRLLLAFAALVLIVAGVSIFVWRSHANQDEAAFQEQLRLARAEGIPTTAAEFTALIPKVSPAENAAPLYRKLQPLLHQRPEASDVDLDLLFHPDPAKLAIARKYVSDQAQPLAIVDEAVKLPKCWFDRNWEDGPATLFPEFADMKRMSRVVALRGTLAVEEGRVEDALADAARIRVIAGHAGSEPTAISMLVGESIRNIGVRELLYWAYLHPDKPQYLDAARKALGEFPKLDVRDMYRDELYGVLAMIRLCSTPEGRAKLGLKEEDVGAGEKIFPILLSRPKAMVEVVKAERDLWAALTGPESERNSRVDLARLDRNRAMLAFPTALSIFGNLSSGDEGVSDPAQVQEGRKVQYLAMIRALSQRPIPKKIRTDDLRSPYDGKPVGYQFDGKQIRISLSTGSDTTELLLPPKAAIKK